MASPGDGSGWTLSTLLTHVTALLGEMDRRYQQRFEAQQKALDAALLAAKEAVQAALEAAKEAVLKAELSVDERLKLLNELRHGVATTSQLDALEKIVEALKERQDRADGKSTGLNAGWVILLGALGAVGTIAGLIAVAMTLKS